jgi:hypothetical protein
MCQLKTRVLQQIPQTGAQLMLTQSLFTHLGIEEAGTATILDTNTRSGAAGSELEAARLASALHDSQENQHWAWHCK